MEREREALRALTAGAASDDDAAAGGRPAESAAPSEETLLWVQQYAPRSYLQLLSAEEVNVKVLTWLKSWDAVVFGKGGSDPGRRGLPAAAADQRPPVKGILLAGNPGAARSSPGAFDTLSSGPFGVLW